MMKTKTITLAVTLLFCASGFIYADEKNKKIDDLNVEVLPDGTVKIVPVKKLIEKELKDYVSKLVEDFNTAKPSVYKSYYHFPHAKVFSTEIEWISDPDKPVVDFDKLRATGWDKNQNWIVKVIGFNKGQDTTLIPTGYEPFQVTRSDAAGLGIVCRVRI